MLVTWKASNPTNTTQALEFCILVKAPDVILTGAARKSQSTHFETAFMKILPTKGHRHQSFFMTANTAESIFIPALSLERNNGEMKYAVKQDGEILPAFSAGNVQNKDASGNLTWMEIKNIPQFKHADPTFSITETSVRMP